MSMHPAIEAMCKRLGLTDPTPQMVASGKAMAMGIVMAQRQRKGSFQRALEARFAMDEVPEHSRDANEVRKAQRRLDNETVKQKLRGELVYKHEGPNRAMKKRLRVGYTGPVPVNRPYREPTT